MTKPKYLDRDWRALDCACAWGRVIEGERRRIDGSGSAPCKTHRYDAAEVG